MAVMSGLVVVEVPSLWSGPRVKPERQSVGGEVLRVWHGYGGPWCEWRLR